MTLFLCHAGRHPKLVLLHRIDLMEYIAVQELVALASAKEAALQAIQEMEDAKLRLAEGKMARLARVEGALQAQLRAAGGALDEHAGACCS